MKIVFFGSSGFSLPSLECCLELHETVLVITTPDKPKGRGLEIQPNPVKVRAEKAGVPVETPFSLKQDDNLEKKISALKPDLFVVASYGKIIPPALLCIPKIIPLNVHPSLLPKYRGAAPIAWQIADGVKETGVTIAVMTDVLDAGDIIHQIRIPLASRATAESLTEDLSRLARKALEEVFGKIERGDLSRISQKEAESNYARKLVKEDGCLNLGDSAETLERKIRAFHPWPGTFIAYETKVLRILEAEAESSSDEPAEAVTGAVLETRPLKIQTGKGSLKLLKVQRPGRRPVSGADLANGLRLKRGMVFKSLKDLKEEQR